MRLTCNKGQVLADLQQYVATKMTDRCSKPYTPGRGRGLCRAAAGRLGSGQRGAGPRRMGLATCARAAGAA